MLALHPQRTGDQLSEILGEQSATIPLMSLSPMPLIGSATRQGHRLLDAVDLEMDYCSVR